MLVETKRQRLKKWLQRMGYFGLIAFAIAFALTEVADAIASMVRALPALVNTSTGLLQGFSLLMGTMLAVTNMLVLIIALPRALKTLKRLNPFGILRRYCAWRFGLFRLDYAWDNLKYTLGFGKKPNFDKHRELAKAAFPKRRDKAILTASIFSFFTGISFGFFTASSAQTAVVGVATLFGFTVSTGGAGILAIVVALGIVQAISMFLVLSAECGNIVDDIIGKDNKFKWINLRRFFMIGEFAPKNRYEHAMRIGKVGFSLLGGLFILGAAVFVLMGQGQAVSEVMANRVPAWITTVTQVAVIYIMAGITQISLSIRSSGEIMGNVGKRLGAWVGLKLAGPKLKAQIVLDKVRDKEKESKQEKPWVQQSFPEKIQTALNKVPFKALTLFLVSFSFLGAFFEGMRGDSPLHGKLHGVETDNTNITGDTPGSFHEITNALEQNPALIKQVDNIKPAAIEWQAITAGTFTGVDEALKDAFLLHEKEDTDTPEVEISTAIPSRFKRYGSYNTTHGRLFRKTSTRFARMPPMIPDVTGILRQE